MDVEGPTCGAHTTGSGSLTQAAPTSHLSRYAHPMCFVSDVQSNAAAAAAMLEEVCAVPAARQLRAVDLWALLALMPRMPRQAEAALKARLADGANTPHTCGGAQVQARSSANAIYILPRLPEASPAWLLGCANRAD